MPSQSLALESSIVHSSAHINFDSVLFAPYTVSLLSLGTQ